MKLRGSAPPARLRTTDLGHRSNWQSSSLYTLITHTPDLTCTSKRDVLLRMQPAAACLEHQLTGTRQRFNLHSENQENALCWVSQLILDQPVRNTSLTSPCWSFHPPATLTLKLRSFLCRKRRYHKPAATHTRTHTQYYKAARSCTGSFILQTLLKWSKNLCMSPNHHDKEGRVEGRVAAWTAWGTASGEQSSGKC